MELEITKLILGADNASAGGFHVAVLELPFHLAVSAHPMRKILAVEEYGGVRRRRSHVTERFSRRDDARLRAIAIVNMPLGSRNQRCVFITKSLQLSSPNANGRTKNKSKNCELFHKYKCISRDLSHRRLKKPSVRMN